uniref:Uncharacterized protein n=2 Tax=Oryza sativa subsp. japonica TaxID=39947 RepID=Q10IN4_ORYSJ|nr:hypothetical protein [Oryza sativa Japonica Group]ABF96955.1 hypothetical protein LOC_Os03g33660 [Oryza sativa Japonica Group]
MRDEQPRDGEVAEEIRETVLTIEEESIFRIERRGIAIDSMAFMARSRSCSSRSTTCLPSVERWGCERWRGRDLNANPNGAKLKRLNATSVGANILSDVICTQRHSVWC